MTKESTKIQSIAIFRALQLGDMVCSIPAIKSIRRTYPDAKITLIGLPWAESFVKRFAKYIDDFIPFPAYPGLPETEFNRKVFISFLQNIQERRFDLLIQMHGSGVITNPLVELFNAKKTAGFYQEGMYKPSVRHFPFPQGEHEIRTWLKLCEYLGMKTFDERLEFPLFDNEVKKAALLQKEYSLQPNNYICLHPGARNPQRRLSPKKFASIANVLSARGYKVLITGTKDERSIVHEVLSHTRSTVLDLTGKTDIGTLAALLKDAHMLISNDTGVSHIAAAVQTPSVIVYSVSDPHRWAPLNKKLHKVVMMHDPDILDTILHSSSEIPSRKEQHLPI